MNFLNAYQGPRLKRKSLKILISLPFERVISLGHIGNKEEL